MPTATPTAADDDAEQTLPDPRTSDLESSVEFWYDLSLIPEAIFMKAELLVLSSNGHIVYWVDVRDKHGILTDAVPFETREEAMEFIEHFATE